MTQSNPLPASEMSPLDLARSLDRGEPLQVIDVRAPGRVASGRIDLGTATRFVNIRGSELLTLRQLDGTGIDPVLPSIVVCGAGRDSTVVARHLNGLGCRAASLRGGIAAWMITVLPRDLKPPAPLDRLVQFDRVGKGALGYLLVSEGQALIVDPPRDPSAHLDAAKEAGAAVIGVADTHVHADYISGAPALSRALGVPYYLHSADAVYPYDGTTGRLDYHALNDGDTIAVGRCRVLARHTPGHTEGSLTYLVDDAVALTGDFLFVASIGRPDLADKTDEWTELLWESAEMAKRDWQAATLICPAHYAAESERRVDRSVAAPLEELLERNATLRIRDRQEFVRRVRAGAGAFPEAYRKIKAINVGLLSATEAEAQELEMGKNECALGGG